jgi:DNA-binding response OmpR family regulator
LDKLQASIDVPLRFPVGSQIVMLPVLLIASEPSANALQIQELSGGNIGAAGLRPAHSKVLTTPVRPANASAKQSRYVYGPLVLDASRHEVRLSDHEIDLTPKEFGLLEYLLRHPGRIRTREMALNAVWGYDYYGTTRTVDVHIQRIKKKIPLLTSAITCVRSLGYKLRDNNESLS